MNNGINFRLDHVNKIKDYFILEICERETICKGLNMFLYSIIFKKPWLFYQQWVLGYILLRLQLFSFAFSITTGTKKTIKKIKKKKKHNEIVMLARSKLNSIKNYLKR